MGSQVYSVFSPVSLPLDETIERLLGCFSGELDGYLDTYFARARICQEKTCFEFFEETTSLNGKNDLLSRLKCYHGGIFAYELNFEFATSVLTNIAILRNASQGVSVHIAFDKEFSSYMLTSDVTATPFALGLEKIATAIQSSCFVAGGGYENRIYFSCAELCDTNILTNSPWILGWREEVVDAFSVIKTLGAKPEWLQKTLHGYNFISLFGRYQELQVHKM